MYKKEKWNGERKWFGWEDFVLTYMNTLPPLVRVTLNHKVTGREIDKDKRERKRDRG